SVRPRHVGERARAVRGRPLAGGPAGALPHAQRPADGGPAGGVDRDGFSGEDRRGDGGARRVAARFGNRRGEVRRQERLRLPGGSGFRGDGARTGAGPHRPAQGAGARGNRDGAVFAPGSGVDEDPVTGSAHTALGPYWAGILGTSELTGFQASARGGVVRVRVQGERVLLGGQAVTVMTGKLVG